MGALHVHEFMSLDGVIDAPTWTFDYGFDPQMGAALRAGYRSEAAFSKAFKWRFGVSPMAYRRQWQAA